MGVQFEAPPAYNGPLPPYNHAPPEYKHPPLTNSRAPPEYDRALQHINVLRQHIECLLKSKNPSGNLGPKLGCLPLS